jgi:hypothetical protein
MIVVALLLFASPSQSSLDTEVWLSRAESPLNGRTGWRGYTANVDGLQQVMLREVGATTAVQLTGAPFPVRSPWAPDGTRVYFLRGPIPALWSVSAVGGEPELVISPPHGIQPDRATCSAKCQSKP